MTEWRSTPHTRVYIVYCVLVLSGKPCRVNTFHPENSRFILGYLNLSQCTATDQRTIGDTIRGQNPVTRVRLCFKNSFSHTCRNASSWSIWMILVTISIFLTMLYIHKTICGHCPGGGSIFPDIFVVADVSLVWKRTGTVYRCHHLRLQWLTGPICRVNQQILSCFGTRTTTFNSRTVIK